MSPLSIRIDPPLLYRHSHSIGMLSPTMEHKTCTIVLLHGRWPERIEGELIANIPLCNPNNPDNWMGWTKERLEKQGHTVICPVIPDAWKASYEEWKTHLDTLPIDENTILVGWSAGGYVLLRWLKETGKYVRKVILIAPSSECYLEGIRREALPLEHEFYSEKITPSLTSQFQKQMTILVSNDDKEILRSVAFYKETLGAEVIQLENLGHFSFLMPQLPELLAEIEKSADRSRA